MNNNNNMNNNNMNNNNMNNDPNMNNNNNVQQHATSNGEGVAVFAILTRFALAAFGLWLLYMFLKKFGLI